MLVVSDSSPLNFLVRMGCVSVLPSMFGKVAVPPQVIAELSAASTPEAVRAFVTSPPDWLLVESPRTVMDDPKLDLGERAAISLAEEVRADAILLDDRDARRIASSRGLLVIGLIGVIERAGELQLIDLSDAISKLPTDYRIDPAVIDSVVARAARRKAASGD